MYVNYFVHGMGASILAQNSSSLQSLWHTDAAAVLYVISAIGIGRFIALPFSGVMSDKLGRKNYFNRYSILYCFLWWNISYT